MKKKILLVSLAANIIAGAFVFYSFTSNKTKSVNDGGGYVFMRVMEGGNNEVIIFDGSTILETDDLLVETKKSNLNSNSQEIAQKLNEYKNKGYELISSNASGYCTNYIFAKK